MPTQSASNAVVNATVNGTTETAVCITPYLTDQLAHAGGLLVQGQVNVTPGTGQTSITLTIRQGSGTGGQAVQTGQPVTVTAAQPIDLVVYVADGAPAAGSQYTLTVTQAGGAGNATVNTALLTVDEILAA